MEIKFSDKLFLKQDWRLDSLHPLQTQFSTLESGWSSSRPGGGNLQVGQSPDPLQVSAGTRGAPAGKPVTP